MKKLIYLSIPILMVALVLFLQYTPKYKEGDVFCVEGIKVTIMQANSFVSTGKCESAVYVCRYVLVTGEIREQLFCEKELNKLCN